MSPPRSRQPNDGGSTSAPALPPETADIATASAAYARRFAGPVGEWFLDVQRRATLELLEPWDGARILDVGGGHGQIAGALVEAGHEVTVTGSDATCVRGVRELVEAGRAGFDVVDVLELPYADDAFDVVVSYRFLSHVERWRRFLGELARVADAAILIDYPEVRSVNALTPWLFGWKKRVEGDTRTYTCYREAQLLEALEPEGFRRGAAIKQFALPMVLHRALRIPRLSAALERACRVVGLTRRFGSPVILKAVRDGGEGTTTG